MKYLLDTCAFLWMLSDEEKLGVRAREAILDPASELTLSAASSWEIAIKVALRKLTLADPADTLVPSQMARNGIRGLAVEHVHALRTTRLPPHHRDPFDRLLVAQAQMERMVLLTPDKAFAAYDVTTQW